MVFRELKRDEVEQVWTIDRGEFIENVYYLEDGALILKPDPFDVQGWPPGESALYTPILLDCYDRGGTFYGAFMADELIGVAVLESKFMGKDKDQLQLKFLHVSRHHRKKGLGRTLFEQAVGRARELKARRLYISATPSENTVNFYLRLGCVVTKEVDDALFALEPEDIHLEYQIPLATR